MDQICSRLHPRYQFPNPLPALLIDAEKTQTIQTRDISPSGVAFFGNGHWKVGDLITVEVAAFDSQPIRVQARIVRRQEHDGLALFAAQFLGLPLIYQERLFKLIRSAIFSDRVERYSRNPRLGLRMSPAQVAVRLTWTFATVLGVYFFSRIFLG